MAAFDPVFQFYDFSSLTFFREYIGNFFLLTLTYEMI